jgi:hypothetical protein
MDESCKEAGLRKGQYVVISRMFGGERKILPELLGDEGKDAGLCVRIH